MGGLYINISTRHTIDTSPPPLAMLGVSPVWRLFMLPERGCLKTFDEHLTFLKYLKINEEEVRLVVESEKAMFMMNLMQVG